MTDHQKILLLSSSVNNLNSVIYIIKKSFKDTHREKVSSNKIQRLQKVRIWAFGSFVYQINFSEEALKLKQNFQKNKVVTGKTPFFVIGPFCTKYSIYLNSGF